MLLLRGMQARYPAVLTITRSLWGILMFDILQWLAVVHGQDPNEYKLYSYQTLMVSLELIVCWPIKEYDINQWRAPEVSWSMSDTHCLQRTLKNDIGYIYIGIGPNLFYSIPIDILFNMST